MGCPALHAPSEVGHRPRLPDPRAQRTRPHRRRDRVRNRPGAIHRTRADARQSRRAQRRRAAVEHHRRRARSDRQPAPVDSPPARRHGAAVVHHGVRRHRGWRAAPHREVLRPPRGRARDRAGQYARANRIAAPRAHHRRHHAIPAAGGPAAVRRPAPAIAGCGAREPSRTAGAVEVRHLRRPPHRAGDDRGRQPACRS